jgi:hypothetical protein
MFMQPPLEKDWENDTGQPCTKGGTAQLGCPSRCHPSVSLSNGQIIEGKMSNE